MADFARDLKKQTLITALCYLAVGLLFICVPTITANAIAVLFSLALLVFGAVLIVVFFARRSADMPAGASLPVGVVLVLAALVFLIKPALLVSIVYALLGLGVVVNGAIKLRLGIELKRFDSPFWSSVIVASIAAIILGAVAIFAPFETAVTVIILVGISMLCCAVFDAVAALFFIK